MEEKNSYNYPSSNRPDIDANWKKMEQLLDEKTPNRRWVLAILFIIISGILIWYQLDNKTEKNSNNTAFKNDTVQNSSVENTVDIKDDHKKMNIKDSSVAKDVLVENKKLLPDTASTDISKATIVDEFKKTRNKILSGNDASLPKQKNVVSINPHHKKYNISIQSQSIAVAKSIQKNSNIIKDTFKSHLPVIANGNAKVNIDTTFTTTQKNIANNNRVKAGKDAPIQSSAIIDSSKAQKEKLSNKLSNNDSTANKINALTVTTAKTKKREKKNKTISLKPSLSIGISPSVSLQQTGFANSSGLNYLAAADIFAGLNIPLSKHFTLQVDLHPFTGVPLHSDKWEHSLRSLDETHVHADLNHTVTTVTTHTLSGFTSLNLPVTVRYAIIPKLNAYAGIQLSTFLYGGTIKNTFVTDSSATGVHTSSTSESFNIFKTGNSDAIKKTSLSTVWGIDYSFHHFTLGLQYIHGIRDVSNDNFLHNREKNTINDFKFSLKMNIAKRKKI